MKKIIAFIVLFLSLSGNVSAESPTDYMIEFTQLNAPLIKSIDEYIDNSFLIFNGKDGYVHVSKDEHEEILKLLNELVSKIEYYIDNPDDSLNGEWLLKYGNFKEDKQLFKLKTEMMSPIKENINLIERMLVHDGNHHHADYNQARSAFISIKRQFAQIIAGEHDNHKQDEIYQIIYYKYKN